MTTPSDGGGLAPRGAHDPRVTVEDPRGAEARALIVARVGGMALGCGALPAIDARCGELTRMYVAPEALGLYRAAGFLPCAAFADDQPDPLNLFMVKRLAAGARSH